MDRKKQVKRAFRAAQRDREQGGKPRGFRGKYKGPDRFEGDEEKIKAWKAEGRPDAKYRAKSKKQAEVDKAARPERPGDRARAEGRVTKMEYTPEQAEWDKKYGYPGDRNKKKGPQDKKGYRGVGSQGKGRGLERRRNKKYKKYNLEMAAKRNQQTLEDAMRKKAAQS